MTRVALKGLLGRKLRASLTAIAIVLGVAMVSGTYVLTDTIKSAFSTVFTQVYKNTDAVITGKSAIGNNNRGGGQGSSTPSLPASLLTRVHGLPGVAEASGAISDTVGLVGHNGKVISRGGAPGLAFSYSPAGQRFNPLTLTSGSWPSAPNQVVIDSSTASKDNFKPGQPIGVIASGPLQRFQVVGTAKIGGVSSLGGSTIAVFTLPEAQQLFNKQGRLDTINVAADHGTTPQQLVREIQPILPPNGQVRTGQGQAQQATKDTSGFLSIFQSFSAGVWRDRAVRRQLRDREHPVDHDRAADAGARDDANTGCDPPAGAALGAARGVRDRFARLDCRLVPGACAGEGAELTARVLRHRPATGRHRVRDQDRDRLAAGRSPDHGRGGDAPGAARDPDPADRRGSRGSRAAALALRPVRHAGCRCDDLGGGRADADRAVRQRRLDDRAAALDRDRRARPVPRCVDARAQAGAAVGSRARVAGGPARRGIGRARPRQRRAQSVADGVDRVCADDRPDARDAGRGARGGPAIALPGFGQPAVRRQLRRHRERQLHPDRGCLRELRCAAFPA